MKRTIRIFSVIVLMTLALSACEELLNCKTCRIVTYEDGVKVDEGTGVVYCGEELEEKENEPPTTIDNRTTQWECE